MSIAFVQGTGTQFGTITGSTNNTVTFGSTTTSGNLIIVDITYYINTFSTTAVMPTVTDNKSNTYYRAAKGIYSADLNLVCEQWYAYNISGGASHIVTVNVPAGFAAALAVAIHEYSGALSASNPLGNSNYAGGTTNPTSTGNIIVPDAGTLIHGVACSEGLSSVTFTATNSCTDRVDVNAAALGVGISTADKIVNSADAVKWTCSSAASGFVACGASYKSAAAGWSLIAGSALNQGVGANASTQTVSINRNIGDLLVLTASIYYSAGNASSCSFVVTDSLGNKWTQSVAGTGASSHIGTVVFWAREAVGGANTISISAQVGGVNVSVYWGIDFAAFKYQGATGYAEDGSVSNNGTTGDGSSGTLPVSGTNSLGIFAIGQGTNDYEFYTAGAGFTNYTYHGNGSGNEACYSDYQMGLSSNTSCSPTLLTSKATAFNFAWGSASISIKALTSIPNKLYSINQASINSNLW